MGSAEQRKTGTGGPGNGIGVSGTDARDLGVDACSDESSPSKASSLTGPFLDDDALLAFEEKTTTV